jgi:hypothetical protein
MSTVYVADILLSRKRTIETKTVVLPVLYPLSAYTANSRMLIKDIIDTIIETKEPKLAYASHFKGEGNLIYQGTTYFYGVVKNLSNTKFLIGSDTPYSFFTVFVPLSNEIPSAIGIASTNSLEIVFDHSINEPGKAQKDINVCMMYKQDNQPVKEREETKTDAPSLKTAKAATASAGWGSGFLNKPKTTNKPVKDDSIQQKMEAAIEKPIVVPEPKSSSKGLEHKASTEPVSDESLLEQQMEPSSAIAETAKTNYPTKEEWKRQTKKKPKKVSDKSFSGFRKGFLNQPILNQPKPILNPQMMSEFQQGFLQQQAEDSKGDDDDSSKLTAGKRKKTTKKRKTNKTKKRKPKPKRRLTKT